MPIGKMSPSGGDFTGAAEYDFAVGRWLDQNKEKTPQIVMQNFVYGSNYLDVGAQFREVAKLNPKVKKPVMKFSISFDPLEEVSMKTRLIFLYKILLELGVKVDNHQFVATSHGDKNHFHFHVIINRVGLDGSLLSDSFSFKRLELAMDKTEKIMGLNNDLSKARRYVYDPNSEKGCRVQKENFKENRKNEASTSVKKGVQNKKEIILEKLNKHLMSCKSVPELQLKLSKDNVEMLARYDKSDKLTGVSFRYNAISIKASAFGKNYKASRIEQKLKENLEENKNDQNALFHFLTSGASMTAREEESKENLEKEREIIRNIEEILYLQGVYEISDFLDEMEFVDLILIKKENKFYISDSEENMIEVNYFSKYQDSRNYDIIEKIIKSDFMNDLNQRKGFRK